MKKQMKTAGRLPEQQTALLANIVHNPDDDLPRLVLADWLDENGQPERAEFIRVECRRHAAAGGEAGSAERSRRLLERYGDEWAAEFCVRGVKKASFRRGFIEEVTATADGFLAVGEAAWGRTPLRHLTLSRASGRTRRLAASRAVRRLTHLTLKGRRFSDDDLAGLVDGAPAPAYPNLTFLSVTACERLGTAGVTALVESGAVPALSCLWLSAEGVDDGVARALAAARTLEHLNCLHLPGSRIGTDGLLALLGSPLGRRLTALDVSLGRVGEDVFAAMAGVRGRPPIKHLFLLGNPIRAVRVGQVGAALEAFPDVQIRLDYCPLRPRTAAELAKQFGERVITGDDSFRRPDGRRSG